MISISICLLLTGSAWGSPFPKIKQPPKTLSENELNMLHADAVRAGSAGEGNLWFDAIDAGLLDRLITEMNTMNKWFARVVKYWDEFTSGRDGSSVYLEGLHEGAVLEEGGLVEEPERAVEPITIEPGMEIDALPEEENLEELEPPVEEVGEEAAEDGGEEPAEAVEEEPAEEDGEGPTEEELEGEAALQAELEGEAALEGEDTEAPEEDVGAPEEEEPAEEDAAEAEAAAEEKSSRRRRRRF